MMMTCEWFFKSKIRSYFIWYIVGYIIVTIYSCLRYNRPIIYNFFPIKLLPLILARNIGFVLYKCANKESCSVEKFKREFEMMFIFVVMACITMVFVYKITGIDLLWMIL